MYFKIFEKVLLLFDGDCFEKSSWVFFFKEVFEQLLGLIWVRDERAIQGLKVLVFVVNFQSFLICLVVQVVCKGSVVLQ